MATTHEIIKNVVERGFASLDAKIALGLLKQVQIAIPNVALNSADVSPTGTISTLQNIPSLQIVNGVGFNGGYAVIGGRNYKFRAVLPCTIDGTSGGKIDWNGGTATVSAFQATGFNYVGSTATLVKTTTLAGLTMNAAAAYTMSVVEGSFTASGSGSFGPRFATFTGTATAPIVAALAYVELTEIAQ